MLTTSHLYIACILSSILYGGVSRGTNASDPQRLRRNDRCMTHWICGTKHWDETPSACDENGIISKSNLDSFRIFATHFMYDMTKDYDDVIKWKHLSRNWSFARGHHRSPENSPHKTQWRGALMLYLICAWIDGWVNNHESGDLRRHHTHYDVAVMLCIKSEDYIHGIGEYKVLGKMKHCLRIFDQSILCCK